MTTDNVQKDQIHFTEAPASWNVRYITPGGYQAQLTLRANTGSDVLGKADAVIGYLMSQGCKPYSYGNTMASLRNSDAKNDGGQSSDKKGWCPIHMTEMQHWNKNGRSWFSHKVGDTWCQGK
jgi:hypothetical protein